MQRSDILEKKLFFYLFIKEVKKAANTEGLFVTTGGMLVVSGFFIVMGLMTSGITHIQRQRTHWLVCM
jgi:hypothetical protein